MNFNKEALNNGVTQGFELRIWVSFAFYILSGTGNAVY